MQHYIRGAELNLPTKCISGSNNQGCRAFLAFHTLRWDSTCTEVVHKEQSVKRWEVWGQNAHRHVDGNLNCMNKHLSKSKGGLFLPRTQWSSMPNINAFTDLGTGTPKVITLDIIKNRTIRVGGSIASKKNIDSASKITSTEIPRAQLTFDSLTYPGNVLLSSTPLYSSSTWHMVSKC